MHECLFCQGRPSCGGACVGVWVRGNLLVPCGCGLLFAFRKTSTELYSSSLLPHSGSDLQTLFKADKAIQKVLHYTLQQGGMVKYVAGKDDPTNEQRGKKLRKVVATGGGESGGGKVGTSLLDWEIRGVVEATLPSVR